MPSPLENFKDIKLAPPAKCRALKCSCGACCMALNCLFYNAFRTVGWIIFYKNLKYFNLTCSNAPIVLGLGSKVFHQGLKIVGPKNATIGSVSRP